MPWTFEDQEAALAQGCGLFDNSDHGLRIERFDEADIFACDEDAWKFVEASAANCGYPAVKALLMLTREK